MNQRPTNNLKTHLQPSTPQPDSTEPMSIICVRLPPSTISLIDRLITAPPTYQQTGRFRIPPKPPTRSQLLRQAIEIGIDALLNTPTLTTQRPTPCRTGTTNRPKT